MSLKKIGLVFLLIVFLSFAFVAVNADEAEIPPEVEKALNEYIAKLQAESEAEKARIVKEREEVLRKGFLALKIGGISLISVLAIGFIGVKCHKFLMGGKEKQLKHRIGNLLERGYDRDEIKRVLVLEGYDKNTVHDILFEFKRK